MYWPVGAPNVYALTKQADTGNVAHASNGAADDAAKGSKDGLEGDSQTKDSTGESLGEEGEDNGSQDDDSHVPNGREILAVKVSRNGTLFAAITRSTLTVWQTKPTVALASVNRSPQSLRNYGNNSALSLRPDAMVIVLQTELGFLVTYTLETEANALVYKVQLPARHGRKDSAEGYTSYRRSGTALDNLASGQGDGIREISLRFRMVIRIDAGISRSIALDNELLVATRKPAALQIIRWSASGGGSQTSTEPLSRMAWLKSDAMVIEMVHDRPMNLSCWLADDGNAYAVQRRTPTSLDTDQPQNMFKGFCFRQKGPDDPAAVKVAINARFSLISVGCADGHLDIFVVKDYTGNVPLSHRLVSAVSQATSGDITCLSYSPDGYALFVLYEHGWTMWSAYGRQLATSFGTDQSHVHQHDERWLQGGRDGFWLGGGCEFTLLGSQDDRLWFMEMARSAATGCLSAANVARGLVITSGSVSIYKGHDLPDLTALPSTASLWQTVAVPKSYLSTQWPIKAAVISPDGKYVAVAGRRGLAHYSVSSGRWRTFDDPVAENEFSVRGGMCWHQHVLIASVESGNSYQVRIFSREKALQGSAFVGQELSAPAIITAISGSDSLLVYTYDNILLHFIIVANGPSVKLVQVGQIAFNGIIRAPPRVRAISWILPESQLEHGDPAQDVATASVVFLVDGKLVLLQPSTNELGELKYDMRVIAQNVEYHALLRDLPSSQAVLTVNHRHLAKRLSSQADGDHLGHSLRDSLWYLTGDGLHVWSDVQDVLSSAPSELDRELPPTVRISLDFYPISVMVSQGIVNGLDAELIQRRDVNFSFFRQASSNRLFLPQLLRYHLSEYNSPSALHLANSYQHLPYFPHALEMLLHDVLDSEVDNPPDPPETALLPTVLSFLSSFPSYLDVIVNCTRKTELRSWRTLFSYLPPVKQFFDQSLAKGKLKTASGYLLVLHAFESDEFQADEFSALLRHAAADGDWDLCKELSRFLIGIDPTGQTLRAAIQGADLQQAVSGIVKHSSTNGHITGKSLGTTEGGRAVNGHGIVDDYFSIQR